MIEILRGWLRRLVLWLQEPVKRVTGSLDAWLLRREALRSPQPVTQAVRHLPSGEESLHQPSGAPNHPPVFVLGASWRCGTTLVQRMIVESGEILVWGEPFAQAGLIQRLADSLRMLDEDWPPESFYLDRHGDRPLHKSWIACLYPGLAHLRQAHISFFEQLFASPAEAAGYSAWGIKEVRLSQQHIEYLSWLFPAARFVLLVRDPYAAYRSYRRWIERSVGDVGRGWFARWPEKPVFTPMAFGRHWQRRARAFRRLEDDSNKLFLRFGEITDHDPALGRLRHFLSVDLPGEALNEEVGSTSGGEREVGRLEEFLLARQVEPLASDMGY